MLARGRREGGRNRAAVAGKRGRDGVTDGKAPPAPRACAVPCGRIPFHHVCYLSAHHSSGWLLAKVPFYIPAQKAERDKDRRRQFGPKKINKPGSGLERDGYLIASDACVMGVCLQLREVAIEKWS